MGIDPYQLSMSTSPEITMIYLPEPLIYDPYYGSALVHVPQTLSLDLASICADAGYIHSCGLPYMRVK